MSKSHIMRSGNVCTGTHTLVCTGMEGAGPSYLLSSFMPEEAAPHLFSPQARTTFCPQTTFSEGRCGDKSSACGDGVVSRELACLWPTPSMGWLLSAGKMGRIPSRLVQLTSSPFLKRSQPAGKCHQGFPTPIPAQSGDPLGCRVLLSRRWSQACPPPWCCRPSIEFSDRVSFLPFINNFNRFNNVPLHG